MASIHLHPPTKRIFFTGVGAGLLLAALASSAVRPPEPRYLPPPHRTTPGDYRGISFYEELRTTPLSGAVGAGWRVTPRIGRNQGQMYANVARTEIGEQIGNASQPLVHRERAHWGVIAFTVFHSRIDARAGYWEMVADDARGWGSDYLAAGHGCFEKRDAYPMARCWSLQGDTMVMVEAHPDIRPGSVNFGDVSFPRVDDLRPLLAAASAHLERVRARHAS